MLRIGYGWDSHEFKPGVPLLIGGVRLEHDQGLAGHSDGDVLLHAITDGLLGAIAAGDIGTFFPPSDPKWKGADSAVFVKAALERVHKAGWNVQNIDSTLILAAPKIVPVAEKIRARVAELLGVKLGDVSVKAKTPEGMGTENAVIAHVVVLLEKHEDHQKLDIAAALLDADQHIKDVVSKLLREAHKEEKAEPAPHQTEDMT
jgi:2-C-methyl-D-erythritol 2,4-cyclodiphosphate synthase